MRPRVVLAITDHRSPSLSLARWTQRKKGTLSVLPPVSKLVAGGLARPAPHSPIGRLSLLAGGRGSLELGGGALGAAVGRWPWPQSGDNVSSEPQS